MQTFFSLIDPDMLGGVTVLKGKVFKPSEIMLKERTCSVYSNTLLLLGNRGTREMRVWFPM